MSTNDLKSTGFAVTDHVETPSSIIKAEPEGKENVPAGHVPVTPAEKAVSRALNTKLDVFLLPMLSFLYLFNGLDRGNVGNAETQGTRKRIHFGFLFLF